MPGFGASIKNTSMAVGSSASRSKRFFQSKRSIDRLPATNARQSVRTSSTNPAQSVGMLGDSRKVK